MKNIERLEDLSQDGENANEGTLRGAQLLDRSLETYGAGRAILSDKNGLVIAGNKTLESAIERGLGVRVVRSDGRKLVVVQREDLDLKTQPAARELAYLDNRTSEVGLKWNAAQLEKDLERGISLGGMFTEAELAVLLEREEMPEGWAPLPPVREQSLTVALHFDDGEQQDLWLAFLDTLPEDPAISIGAKLCTWVRAQVLPGLDDVPPEDVDETEDG